MCIRDRAVPTAEVLQLAGEGVEQLETYFGAYLPQFFYAMLAPLTLFIALEMCIRDRAYANILDESTRLERSNRLCR